MMTYQYPNDIVVLLTYTNTLRLAIPPRTFPSRKLRTEATKYD
jgi:hypothetical protein